jgi:hypothetical protein
MLLSAVSVRRRCVTCPSARSSVFNWITIAGEVAMAIAAITTDCIVGTLQSISAIRTKPNVSVDSAMLDRIRYGLRRIQRRSSRLPSSNSNRPSATSSSGRDNPAALTSITLNPALPAIRPITA